MIHFEATPYVIKDWLVIQLPAEASSRLPSRGMCMVEGTINDWSFAAPLEPDGKGSHWFRVSEELSTSASVVAGQPVTLEVTYINDWTRPEVLEDLQAALSKAPQAQALWNDITPKAQWEWTRWIRAAKQPKTRDKHVEVAISKLNSGMRRPCCFNASMCSEPYVANNWVLQEPQTV